MFVSGNAFDNSMFFYEQLKLTWLGRVVIPIDFGREIDTASWYPIALDDPCSSFPPFFRPHEFVMTVSGLAIALSFANSGPHGVGNISSIRLKSSKRRIHE